MKQIYTYILMATIAIAFTSCETDDMRMARTLNGTWTGRIDTYYQDRWGLTGETYRTTMYFNQLDAYGGEGYEVDYNVSNPYGSYYYCEFDWEVAGGEIRLRYADSWNDTYIYDYRLYSDYFEGYMDDGTCRDIHFQLTYDGHFNWSNYRGYHRAAATRSSSAAAGSDSIPANARFHAAGEFCTQKPRIAADGANP